MKLISDVLKGKLHTYNIEDGKCIITRKKSPHMTVLYNPETGTGSILTREEKVPESQIQLAFNKVIEFARKNIHI